MNRKMLRPYIEKEDLVEIAKSIPKETTPPAPSTAQTSTPASTPTPPTIITPSSAFWTIENVQYRGKIIPVKLSKSLLDNRAARTQDEYIEYSLEAMKKGEFYTGSMPLQHAIFTAVHKSPESQEKEEIRAFLKKNLF